jgi:anti-anti-sigma factor
MGTVVVVFAGEYDLASKEQLRGEFDALHDDPNIVLDMSAVTYLDSTCIGEIIHLHKARVAKGHAPFAVVYGTPIVKKVFTVLSLENMFRVVPSLDEVLPKDGKPLVVRHAPLGDNAAPALLVPAASSVGKEPDWATRL